MAPRPAFAETWWGRAWVTALEETARLDPDRLARGRTYARQGAVQDLVVQPGVVRGRVTGAQGRTHAAEIAVRTIPAEAWDAVADLVATRSVHAAAMAEGELDPEIVDDARAAGVELFPGPDDLRPKCTCPDWADLCQHTAALAYLVAAELDRDPALLFLVRGLGREQLSSILRVGRHGDSEQSELATDIDRFGVVAAEAWSGRALDEPWQSPIVPAGPLAPRHPGHPAPWEGQVPVGDPVDPMRTTELAGDAAVRAWAMLVDGATSALRLSARGDIARRAAMCETSRQLEVLAGRTRLTVTALKAWVDAWRLAGDDGVAVVADNDSWLIDQTLLAAGRDALVELGVSKRSIALSYDSLGMPQGVKLVIGGDGLWYRLESRSGRSGFVDQLHLVAPPSVDIVELVDTPPPD